MSNSNRLSIGIGALSAVISVALGLLALIAVSAAQAAVVSCPTLITKCGCTITDAKTHTLVNSISSTDGLTGKGDCIDIKHSDAVLDGDFFSADGAGSGVGVRILSGAVRATVQNFDVDTFSCTDGIDGWDIGVEDDAGSANINVNCMNDNVTAGVFLNSVNKTVLDDFNSDLSTGSCIILKNSNQNTFEDFDASGCGVNGITATGSNRNSFSGFSADGNKGDGVNFKNSGRNALSGVEINGNGGNGVTFKNSSRNSLAGVFGGSLGISTNGGDGVFIDPSSNDKVADMGVDGTGFGIEANKLNGIEVAEGSKGNSVLFNLAIGNMGTDLLDDNAACANGKNVWENNCFDTSSPSSCIPLGLGCP
jgi:hypothetical protein